MADTITVKSIKFPLGQKLLKIGDEQSPPQVRFPDGAVLNLEVKRGRVVSGTATDQKGRGLQVIMLKMSAVSNKTRLRGAKAAATDRCAVCVCGGDGGCRCIAVQCPS